MVTFGNNCNNIYFYPFKKHLDGAGDILDKFAQ